MGWLADLSCHVASRGVRGQEWGLFVVVSGGGPRV